MDETCFESVKCNKWLKHTFIYANNLQNHFFSLRLPFWKSVHSNTSCLVCSSSSTMVAQAGSCCNVCYRNPYSISVLFSSQIFEIICLLFSGKTLFLHLKSWFMFIMLQIIKYFSEKFFFPLCTCVCFPYVWNSRT